MADVPRVRTSPFRDLDQLRRDFDELFDRFLGARPSSAASTAMAPVIESFVEGPNLVIKADLPGIDPNDVEVTVSGKNLVLRGRRETTRHDEGRNYLYREVSYGTFERTVPLPEGVKSEQIKASYRNGVLELVVPMPTEATSRKVPIAIEGERGKKK